MAILRDKFHELGNWLNKISWVTIDTKDTLEKIDLDKLSKEELSQLIQKVVKDLGKVEGFIVGADKSTEKMKPFVYAELGRDAEIFDKDELGHCFITRGFRNIVLGCIWPVQKALNSLKGLKGNKPESEVPTVDRKSG